jgi:hypothetical protein
LTDPTGTGADCSQHIHLDFQFGTAAGHLTSIERLNKDTGALDDIALTYLGNGKYRWAFDLDGGSAELFKFEDEAPFVGITQVPEPSTLGLVGLAAGGLAVWRRRRVGKSRSV